MGQAVADLPDPLDSVLSPPARASGTDDLLSQLAGDEIDRLLAEADADRPAPAESKSAVPAAAAPAAGGSPAVPATPDQPAPAPSAMTASPAPEDELDALLNELNHGVQESPAEASAAGDLAKPKTPAEQVADVAGSTAAPADDKIPASGDGPASAPAAMSEATEGVMSPAERDALSLSSLAAATDAAERQDAAAAATAVAVASPAADAPPRFGVAIRLLELINAPAAAVPDAARDVLGKAAIVTLVNSIAVLIYVLFLRH